MVQVLPQQIKDVWEIWNIKGLLILSLSLQAILIFSAPFRKRVSAKSLTMLLWSCYLLADWSANFAAGLVSKNQWKDPKPNDSPQDKKLIALWLPFLLLHLGGPDTITAFSLEDNALWTRHLLGLVFQALVGVFVVLQSLPNPLWKPILLLFIAGITKYFERIVALNAASSGKFRHSGIQTKGLKRSDVEEGFEERTPTKILGILAWLFRGQKRPMEIVKPDRGLTDLEIVHYAYKLFCNFTSLISNFIFSFKDVKASKALFTALESNEALMVLETELCFIYDALYTKSPVLHTIKGFLFRVLASGSLIWAFCMFHSRDQKRLQFQGTDIVITYILFLTGIALDLASALEFLLSDWTLAVNPDSTLPSVSSVLQWFLGFKSQRWERQICYKTDDFTYEHEVLATPFLLRRWAGDIYAFNFFDFFLKIDGKKVQNFQRRRDSNIKSIINTIQTRLSCGSIVKWIHVFQGYIVHFMTTNKVACYTLYPAKVFFQFCRLLVGYMIDRLDVKDLIDDIRVDSYVSSVPLTKTLWSFIYNQVKYKSTSANTEEETKIIASARGKWALQKNRYSGRLIHYVDNVDYDESILLWHIATEICYQEEEENPSRDHHGNNDREFSKAISDYMMYLMILQPQLMSDVAGLGMLRFKDAMAETEEFLEESVKKSKDVKLAIEKILSLDNDGNKLVNESILQGANSIVKELKKLEGRKWKILSNVWAELLCFASLHCDAMARLELLSKGGELIAFVWLSMAHFGLVD